MRSAARSSASSERKSLTSSGCTPGSLSSPSIAMRSAMCTMSLRGPATSQPLTESRSKMRMKLPQRPQRPLEATSRTELSESTQAPRLPSRPAKTRLRAWSPLPYFISWILLASSFIDLTPKGPARQTWIFLPSSVMRTSEPPKQCVSISNASSFVQGKNTVSLLQKRFEVRRRPSPVSLMFLRMMGFTAAAADDPLKPLALAIWERTESYSPSPTCRRTVSLPMLSVRTSLGLHQSTRKSAEAMELHGNTCLAILCPLPCVVTNARVVSNVPGTLTSSGRGFGAVPPFISSSIALRTVSMASALPVMLTTKWDGPSSCCGSCGLTAGPPTAPT
mmetsp:Transcript_37742/g.102142  ORF Transcript_37742/g.102142 Transcript_37742/m.102142 type:complete len:334 (+) Transcript_37742:246-1247(+)